eukprot:jgi/Chlat1/5163/Chrsp33S05155
MQIQWKKGAVNGQTAKRQRLRPSPLAEQSEEVDAAADSTQLVAREHSAADEVDSASALEASRRQQEAGNALAEAGRWEESLRAWNKAVALTPNRAALHEARAQVLLETGDTWSALQAATRATELEPEWADALVTLGRTRLHLGEPALALESFEQALRLEPTNAAAREELDDVRVLVLKQRAKAQAAASAAAEEHEGDYTMASAAGKVAAGIVYAQRVPVVDRSQADSHRAL